MAIGRFAPSPTGDLHLGNLRTALVAWLAARSVGGRFLVRIEDLDRHQSSPEMAHRQLEDLTTWGIDWEGAPVVQSDRFDRYHAIIADLDAAGLLYPCYCSRREIAEAASAPHGSGDGDANDEPDRAYPGTCRDLSAADRRRRESDGRPPALRLRGPDGPISFDDVVFGHRSGTVDDVVVCRNDGVVAYNLAVVIDDADSGVTDVVRGDDLLGSTSRQLHIAATCGLPAPTYAHVPLVMAPNGERLAKRHGAVTLRERVSAGDTVETLVGVMAHSLGLRPSAAPATPSELVDDFDWARVHRTRWTIPTEWATSDYPN